jgi:hypothetical protein
MLEGGRGEQQAEREARGDEGHGSNVPSMIPSGNPR